jgi:hypothetical protein
VACTMSVIAKLRRGGHDLELDRSATGGGGSMINDCTRLLKKLT